MDVRIFQVKLMFFDTRNNVICHWSDRVSALDPASACHTGLLKARIVHGRRILTSSRMDVSVKEVLAVAYLDDQEEVALSPPPYLVA